MGAHALERSWREGKFRLTNTYEVDRFGWVGDFTKRPLCGVLKVFTSSNIRQETTDIAT